VERPLYSSSQTHTQPQTETFHRPRTIQLDAPALTPDQQALDQRLRDWRKSESEKLGLPQFFVFGSSALRTIVLKRPRNLSELRATSALDHEKLERFGSSILELCKA
jgi:ATP-dependent DNA helicase RecQ